MKKLLVLLISISSLGVTSCKTEQERRIDYIVNHSTELLDNPDKFKKLVDEVAFNSQDKIVCSFALLSLVFDPKVNIIEIKKDCK